MNHFAVYLKLTQHCKSAILQFKKVSVKKKERLSYLSHFIQPAGNNGTQSSKPLSRPSQLGRSSRLIQSRVRLSRALLLPLISSDQVLCQLFRVSAFFLTVRQLADHFSWVCFQYSYLSLDKYMECLLSALLYVSAGSHVLEGKN